jgi:NADPH-dependent curcumin reductase CurA
MMNLTSKEIRLKARPNGMPKDSDFEVATTEARQPGEGEVLVRNIWMSVDPSRSAARWKAAPSARWSHPRATS